MQVQDRCSSIGGIGDLIAEKQMGFAKNTWHSMSASTACVQNMFGESGRNANESVNDDILGNLQQSFRSRPQSGFAEHPSDG